MDNPGDSALNEQLAYHHARAPEYDEWWPRQRRCDRGAELNAQWFADMALLKRALREFGPRGSILEFAPGTGLWSQRLHPHATQLTLVDLASNASSCRLNDGRTFRICKIFYEPTQLQERLARGGWNAAVQQTPLFFLHGGARQ